MLTGIEDVVAMRSILVTDSQEEVLHPGRSGSAYEFPHAALRGILRMPLPNNHDCSQRSRLPTSAFSLHTSTVLRSQAVAGLRHVAQVSGCDGMYFNSTRFPPYHLVACARGSLGRLVFNDRGHGNCIRDEREPQD